jgi:hypothetical protein
LSRDESCALSYAGRDDVGDKIHFYLCAWTRGAQRLKRVYFRMIRDQPDLPAPIVLTSGGGSGQKDGVRVPPGTALSRSILGSSHIPVHWFPGLKRQKHEADH